MYVRGFGAFLRARNAEVHPAGARADEIAARAISHGGIPMGNPTRAHRRLRDVFLTARARSLSLPFSSEKPGLSIAPSSFSKQSGVIISTNAHVLLSL